MHIQQATDTAWHPLADGYPPKWASEWGQDGSGIFIAFTLGEVTQRLRWIPPGRFLMGSPDDEQGRWEAEGPQHRVTIRQGYWLFDTPCTQALWETVMGLNPSRFIDPNRPVEQVSWGNVQGFIERINDRISGLELVLPSEAQWEYACRASTETALFTGAIDILGDANAPALDPIAWYGGNSSVNFELENGLERTWLSDMQFPEGNAGTHPVKRKQPNPWGLYDMLGNVWEWVQDPWHENYEAAPDDGSVWGRDEIGTRRVIRGGSWSSYACYCRSANRYSDDPGDRDSHLGFRCARVQS